ncbi:hypothetical protein JRQ81_010623 [Phrynocephalus forsythii]|uniref:Proton-coupled zinc antiporter SLC30A8 n=1 Tax=Phrynocephalus forsythii TaxID=171643 RepID=A0A9Q1B5A4_9SAUR|nr:hypothetical protein JRQ81_010623 [Phrynocephalus forsythii]
MKHQQILGLIQCITATTTQRRMRAGNRNDIKPSGKLYVASVISFIFMIAEIVGGHIAGSLAVMTDAAHVLVDFMSFLISIFSLWLSAKPPSKNLTYGWHRAEILGAFLSVIFIWLVTGVLTYLSILRLLHPDYEIEATVMLITSGCAVIANIILSLTLHQTGHVNLRKAHHSSSHICTSEEISASSNPSVRAAFIHAIGDLLQSVSVLISALVIFFKPECKMADPICTFIFSIFMTVVSYSPGMPKGLLYDEVKGRILTLDKVESVHSLHVWSLTMSQMVLSAHIVTAANADNKDTLNEITELLFDTYSFHTVTLQIEPKEDQNPNCIFCQDPRS